jgi:cytochrome o ubiquinol oxidase subunit 2
MSIKVLRGLLLPAVALLAGCQTVLMSPSGDVALQQRNLIITSLLLMLIIIVPVIALTLLFAWRYRASNKKAAYDPDWNHSTMLELLIWSAPLLIIIALGAVTWVSTHKLDPYRPLDRLSAGHPVPAGVKPLTVEVVALDWKWLFIYPEQGIATVNDLAAPVDRPIQFKITASNVMNSFFIPALAGQIYAMPGMETTLQAVINKPGDFEGMSANYSGAGFSGMHFTFHGMSEDAFAQWVSQAKAGSTLDRAAYLQLAQPSQDDPVRRYSSVTPGLYASIVDGCVRGEHDCAEGMLPPAAASAAMPAAMHGHADGNMGAADAATSPMAMPPGQP